MSDQLINPQNNEDARFTLQMRYYDARLTAEERFESFPDYKDWLEHHVLKLQAARTEEQAASLSLQERVSKAEQERDAAVKLAGHWETKWRDLWRWYEFYIRLTSRLRIRVRNVLDLVLVDDECSETKALRRAIKLHDMSRQEICARIPADANHAESESPNA